MITEQKLLDLVKRLREYTVSAPPEHPVHPKICDEAANLLTELKYRVVDPYTGRCGEIADE